MKRNVKQAAALLPATASQRKGRESSSDPSVSIFEVDLTDGTMTRHFENPQTDLLVKLEELFPADPGQLSGVFFRIMASGKGTVLSLESPAPQELGSSLTHWFGYLKGAKLADVGAADPTDPTDTFLIYLREPSSMRDGGGNLYPIRGARMNAFSGVTLTLLAGDNPELRVAFGNHCLGVLRGRSLTLFLYFLHQRCEGAEE